MKRFATIFNREPVVILASVIGVVSVLAEQHVIPPWVSLAVIAGVTPVQRALVTPTGKLRKLGATVRKELRI